MTRSNPMRLALFLVAVLVVLGGFDLARGGILLSKHEGDMFHLLDILTRMAAGERIHQDFSTPIGIAAFLPMLPFTGLGYGHAMLWGQILVAAAMLPAIWWVTVSRLTGWAAYLGGFYMLLLPLALSYGALDGGISMSMHYNRWCWAASYLAILTAVVAARVRARPLVDGLVIGLALSMLALTKATFFVAIAGPVLLALALRRQHRSLAVVVVAGLAVIGAMTLWRGTGYWIGYLQDLLQVARTDVRPYPGESFGTILAGPAALGGTLALLAAVVILRQGRRRMAGLGLLLLLPALAYVTYQNYGNDPQWLILLALLLHALRPEPAVVNGLGWNMRRLSDGLTIAVLALALGPFLNLAYSPTRHLALPAGDAVPLVARNPAFADIQTAVRRAYDMVAMQRLDGPDGPYAAYRERAPDKDAIAINGEVLASCRQAGGLSGALEVAADDLEAAGYGGRGIFEADILSALPLFGDFRALHKGAPWYYGGTAGIEDADLVLVPQCPFIANARKLKVEALFAAGIELRELRRTGTYILFEKVAPAPGSAAVAQGE